MPLDIDLFEKAAKQLANQSPSERTNIPLELLETIKQFYLKDGLSGVEDIIQQIRKEYLGKGD